VPSPSAPPPLRLYTRQGCCLCEGLQERLQSLEPAPSLELVDVDADPSLQARYGLLVPVLAVATAPAAGATPAAGTAAAAGAVPPWRQLPPVPPRLAGPRLAAWLAGHGAVSGAAVPLQHGAGDGL
jgi:hypothetical protein